MWKLKTTILNIVLKLVYRPPNSDQKEVENHFKSSLSKWEISNKNIILAGDFNIIYQILMQTKKIKVL